MQQDNGLKDASALTLRTLLGYSTGSVKGFSATVEFEDSRIVAGQGDYSVPQTGYNSGIYSVIVDPETTELDQGYVQYQSDTLNIKAGRQLITYDGHRFVDYGPDYAAITNAGIDGGFFTSTLSVSTEKGSVLVVLYSESLQTTLQKIVDSGGKTLKDIFSFPGGRRFHFADPNGNEYAVWSDK